MDRHPLGRATAHGAHFVKWPLAALLALTLAACGGSDNGNPPALNVDASGASSFNAGQLASNLGTYALESLSAAEITSLQFMREEEQLAHDVYAASALLWPQPIFSNIAASESTHAAAVQTLLDRYQLDDPRTGLADGQYRDAALQALHDQFVQRSRLSLVEALRVAPRSKSWTLPICASSRWTTPTSSWSTTIWSAVHATTCAPSSPR